MAKIEPLDTDSDEYREEDRRVYHDQSECGYGEIKRNGHDVAGAEGRDLCGRCEDLAELFRIQVAGGGRLSLPAT